MITELSNGNKLYLRNMDGTVITDSLDYFDFAHDGMELDNDEWEDDEGEEEQTSPLVYRAMDGMHSEHVLDAKYVPSLPIYLVNTDTLKGNSDGVHAFKNLLPSSVTGNCNMTLSPMHTSDGRPQQVMVIARQNSLQVLNTVKSMQWGCTVGLTNSLCYLPANISPRVAEKC
jgi:hypothetical protein